MVNFSCELIGRGWMKAELTNEEDVTNLTASRLSDGIRDFVTAIFLLLEGNVTSQCSWQEEPGQYRWIFQINNSIVKVRVLWFEQAFSRLDNIKGQEVFLGEESLMHFGRMVARSIQKLIDYHGEKEYYEKWGYEFPRKEFERLKKSLKSK